MEIDRELGTLLDEVLDLRHRGIVLGADAALLGAIPHLDSMAVVALIERIEDHFGLSIADTEIDGAVFTSLRTLTDFVAHKMQA